MPRTTTIKPSRPVAQRQKQMPRGIRNNNPANIRIGNVWLGEVQINTDGEFEQFVSMEYGCRAAFVLLRRYINHYKLTSLRSIITRWAPRNENDTAAYIAAVSKRTGLDPDAVLSFFHQDTMVALLSAMIVQECGQTVPNDTIIKGYKMA